MELSNQLFEQEYFRKESVYSTSIADFKITRVRVPKKYSSTNTQKSVLDSDVISNRIRSEVNHFFLDPEWITSRSFVKKLEQDQDFILCFIR